MSQKPFIFHIYSLIIFALLLKNCVNSLLDEYYQKLFLGITISYTYQLIPSLTYIKKNIFSRFFLFGLLHIGPLNAFFSKKYSSLTFVIGNFACHATYHSKHLKEYISKIYSFIGEKPFNFNIQSVIIFPNVLKIYLNSLSHECTIYQIYF